jgi:hypothetical protein
MTLDPYGHLMSERVTEAATLYDPFRQAATSRKARRNVPSPGLRERRSRRGPSCGPYWERLSSSLARRRSRRFSHNAVNDFFTRLRTRAMRAP